MFRTKLLLIDKLSFMLLIVLLFLRYPLLFGSQFGNINHTVATIVFLSGTYLCTGIFICRNLKNLYRYCISTPALVLFLLSPIMAYFSNPNDPTTIIRIAMAVVFAAYCFKKRNVISAVKNDVKTIIQNSLFVIVCILITTLLFAYIRGFSGVENPVTLSQLILGLMFQVSYAAVSEEPLFRGFLWGSFRQLGLNEIWICILQALLFWLGHIYYLNTGINFWMVIPIGSLVLGLVIIKTKSITYSMITHSFINTLGDIFQHFIKLF